MIRLETMGKRFWRCRAIDTFRLKLKRILSTYFNDIQVISLAGQKIALSIRDVDQKTGKDLTPMTDQVCAKHC